MNRRTFFQLSAGIAMAGSLHGDAGSPAETSPKLKFTRNHAVDAPFRMTDGVGRPHIFLISIDMVSPDLYHPDRPLAQHVKIPAIRSLMEQGVFFSNTFCTVPVCAPSRASYLTGRYSYIQGNGERAPDGLQTQLRADDVIFPEYLKASGYVTRQVGKCHVGAQKFVDVFGENDQPWDRWSPPVFDDDNFLAYQRGLGIKPQKYSREIVFRLPDRRSAGNSAGGWIVQEDGKSFPRQAQYSYYLGQKAIETVENLVANGTSRKHPLYVQLDIFDPHQPFSIPEGFEQREEELRSVMSLPETYKAVQRRNWARDTDDPEILDVYRNYWGLYDQKALLDYRVAYVLQMELVDEVVGRYLQRLKDLGLYDNSMIVLISDHGEMNGRQALVDKGVYLHPDTIRVPMVIKPPVTANIKPSVSRRAASLLDLSQTILEVAGISAEAKFDGVSLCSRMVGGGADEERTLLFFGGWHVGVNFACGLQHLRQDGRRFLYAYNCSSPCDQLYDLDSQDAVNLIANPDYADIREEMIRRLGAALQADPRWLGYWAEFRVARFQSLPKSQGDMQLFESSS
jgi:arylsulfatase A-like enzyme